MYHFQSRGIVWIFQRLLLRKAIQTLYELYSQTVSVPVPLLMSVPGLFLAFLDCSFLASVQTDRVYSCKLFVRKRRPADFCGIFHKLGWAGRSDKDTGHLMIF